MIRHREDSIQQIRDQQQKQAETESKIQEHEERIDVLTGSMFDVVDLILSSE